MHRVVLIMAVVLMVASACGDDDVSQDGTVATGATNIGTETTEAPPTTEAATTTVAGITSAPNAEATGDGQRFCELFAEAQALQPYLGSPAEIEAAITRVREIVVEYRETAPPELQEALELGVPRVLAAMDYVESVGFQEAAIDIGFIESEFYGSDQAQAADRTVGEWVGANC